MHARFPAAAAPPPPLQHYGCAQGRHPWQHHTAPPTNRTPHRTPNPPPPTGAAAGAVWVPERVCVQGAPQHPVPLALRFHFIPGRGESASAGAPPSLSRRGGGFPPPIHPFTHPPPPPPLPTHHPPKVDGTAPTVLPLWRVLATCSVAAAGQGWCTTWHACTCKRPASRPIRLPAPQVALWSGLVTCTLMVLSPIMFDRLGWRGVANFTPQVCAAAQAGGSGCRAPDVCLRCNARFVCGAASVAMTCFVVSSVHPPAPCSCCWAAAPCSSWPAWATSGCMGQPPTQVRSCLCHVPAPLAQPLPVRLHHIAGAACHATLHEPASCQVLHTPPLRSCLLHRCLCCCSTACRRRGGRGGGCLPRRLGPAAGRGHGGRLALRVQQGRQIQPVQAVSDAVARRAWLWVQECVFGAGVDARHAVLSG